MTIPHCESSMLFSMPQCILMWSNFSGFGSRETSIETCYACLSIQSYLSLTVTYQLMGINENKAV